MDGNLNKDADIPAQAPTITIKDFLDLVNNDRYGAPSTFSKDVYSRLGYAEQPDGYYKGQTLHSSHNLQEGTNAIEDAVIRNARTAQDLYNSGVSVADYMAHSVYDPEVAVERCTTFGGSFKVIDLRMAWYPKDSADIMIISKGKILRILRY